MTKTQIDRLGDRLRQGHVSETDLHLLDQYRLSFAKAYQDVVETIRNRLDLAPTGRPAKSTISIVQKLCRESIRLSQIQDIAGCRLVVSGIIEQERVVGVLREQLDEIEVVDRRAHPSHGYRAVHLIVTSRGRVVEVQVRTELQHLWAQLSEKLSDVTDPAIKYGGGTEAVRRKLHTLSNMIESIEALERRIAMLIVDINSGRGRPADSLKEEIETLWRDQSQAKKELADILSGMIAKLKAAGEP